MLVNVRSITADMFMLGYSKFMTFKWTSMVTFIFFCYRRYGVKVNHSLLWQGAVTLQIAETFSELSSRYLCALRINFM